MKKKALIFAMAGMMAVTTLTGCSSFNGNETAVTIDKEEVSADIANFYARYTQAQYETSFGAYFGENMWSSEAEEGKSYEESVKDTVIENLELMVLSEKHMEDYGVTLSDKEKELIQKAAKEFDEDNALKEKEKVSGDAKTAERVMTLLVIQQKVREEIEKGVDTEVSDEEAAQKSMKYVLFPYTTTDESGQSAQLSDDEKAKAKEKAKELSEKAKDGGDFEELAKEQELEVSTATFDEESTAQDADLIQAADALKKGEVTDVIETDAGCYVAEVTSLKDKDATEQKKEQIVSQRKSELYSEVTEGWLDDAKIKVNKSVWKEIDFNELSVSMKQEENEPYTDEVKTDDVAEQEAEEAE